MYADVSAKEFIILCARYYSHTNRDNPAHSFPTYRRHHPLLRAFTEKFLTQNCIQKCFLDIVTQRQGRNWNAAFGHLRTQTRQSLIHENLFFLLGEAYGLMGNTTCNYSFFLIPFTLFIFFT